MDSSITIKFPQESSLKRQYFRNNCSNGIRSIRCFPTCGPSHSEKGFCGEPMLAEISSVFDQKNGRGIDLSKAKIIGEFQAVESSYLRNQSILEEDLEMNCKSKANPTLPWFLGQTVQKVENRTMDGHLVQVVLVDFNK
eukprot:gene40864-54093_t